MVGPLGGTPSLPRYPPNAPKKALCDGLVCTPCKPLMMCSRSLYGSSASIGSGNFTLASEPLALMPAGIAVAGSNPWFCMKKITRLGEPCFAARATLGSIGPATAAAAKPLSTSLRVNLFFVMVKLDMPLGKALGQDYSATICRMPPTGSRPFEGVATSGSR